MAFFGGFGGYGGYGGLGMPISSTPAGPPSDSWFNEEAKKILDGKSSAPPPPPSSGGSNIFAKRTGADGKLILKATGTTPWRGRR